MPCDVCIWAKKLCIGRRRHKLVSQSMLCTVIIILCGFDNFSDLQVTKSTTLISDAAGAGLKTRFLISKGSEKYIFTENVSVWNHVANYTKNIYGPAKFYSLPIAY